LLEGKSLSILVSAGHVATSLLRDDSGATAIEYGLIAALIAVAAIAAFNAVGSSLTATFNGVASDM
jgi:pilus assembly protein Flp/PilA